MKKEKAKYYARNFENIEQRDRIFLRNPVFITGLGLAPIVVAATNMNNAFILGFAVALLLIPTRVFSAIISRFVLYRFRSIVYAVVSAIVYIGVYCVVRYTFGTQIQAVGIYLPLLVLDPLIIKRYEKPSKEKISTAFSKGLLTTLGFELALFIMAAIREIMAHGTIFDIKILAEAPMPAVGLVSGGFILMGLIAALWRAVIAYFKKTVYEEVAQDGRSA